MENATGDVVGDALWRHVRDPRGGNLGSNLWGLPGVGTTGDVVGGDLGGSTEGRRLRAPGGKRGRFAAPPSDVYLDGWRDLIRDP